MIGSTVEHAQRLLEAKDGARGDQREGEPQRRRAGAAGQRQEQRVPGHAAAAAAGEAAQAPDLLGRQALDQQRRHEGAVAVLEGLHQDAQDRPGGEQQRSRPPPSVTAPATKASPPKRAAQRQADRQQRQAARSAPARAPAPMPDLARSPSSPNSAVSQPCRPAAQADAERLGDEQHEADDAGDQQSSGAAPLARSRQQRTAQARQRAPAAHGASHHLPCATICARPEA